MRNILTAPVLLPFLFLAACAHHNDDQNTAAEETAPATQLKTGNGVANAIMLEGVTREGATFTFKEVKIDRPGWLVMHPFRNGAPVPTEYVGATLLSQGSHQDVEITINSEPEAGEMFVIMLHYDVNEDGIFDFNDGVTVPDAPVFEDGVLIALRFSAP